MLMHSNHWIEEGPPLPFFPIVPCWDGPIGSARPAPKVAPKPVSAVLAIQPLGSGRRGAFRRRNEIDEISLESACSPLLTADGCLISSISSLLARQRVPFSSSSFWTYFVFFVRLPAIAGLSGLYSDHVDLNSCTILTTSCRGDKVMVTVPQSRTFGTDDFNVKSRRTRRT